MSHRSSDLQGMVTDADVVIGEDESEIMKMISQVPKETDSVNV